jgi:senataxin
MMRSAKSDKAATSAAPTPARAGSSKAAPIDVDDFDDDFLDNFSAKDLDIIEKRAKMSTALPKGLAPPVRPPPAKPRPPPTEKLKINVVPRSHAPPPPRPRAAGPQSKFMKDLRKEMRQENIERRRVIGGVVPRLPAASGLGTGLGAYQPRPVQRVVKPVESSGSSASEDSDDDKGLGALIKKQKSPLKAARTVPALERRPIKVLGTAMADVIRQREDRRAQQLATKQRLKPDLSPLYRYVLGWDPGFTGPLAPHPPRHAAELSAPGPVPSTFATPEHYEKVMLPLFLQELWAQCQKEQTMVPLLTVEITGRNYEDDFLDMEIGLQAPFPPKYNLNETDMVILRQPGNPKHVFAKVQGIRRKFKDTAMKLRILNMYDQKALANRSKWQLQKHVS